MSSTPPSNHLIKIGTLARNAHVSLRTLRYYEEIGLISPATHSKGGHRLYQGDDGKKLQVINYLKLLPLSLDEIKEIFTAKKNASGRDKKEQAVTLSRLLESKLDAVNLRIRELTQVKEELSGMVEVLHECSRCDGKSLFDSGNCEECKALDRLSRIPLMMSVFLERGV